MTTAVAIYSAWSGKTRHRKGVQSFGLATASRADALEIRYIVDVSTENKKSDSEVFLLLREASLNQGLQSPNMSWPYLSLKTDSDLVMVRMICERLTIYDFHTSKKLSK